MAESSHRTDIRLEQHGKYSQQRDSEAPQREAGPPEISKRFSVPCSIRYPRNPARRKRGFKSNSLTFNVLESSSHQMYTDTPFKRIDGYISRHTMQQNSQGKSGVKTRTPTFLFLPFSKGLTRWSHEALMFFLPNQS